jgi:uridine kinase
MAPVVGIDGLGGSGKSRLADALRDELSGAAQIVRMDDFCLPSDLRPAQPETSGDLFDWRRLRDDVLVPIASGADGGYRRYDWASDSVEPATHRVEADAPVIVEGVSALRRELRDLYQVRVFVTCPRAVRLRRGVARDGEGALRRWCDLWMPAEDRYLRTHDPEAAADIVVRGDDPDPRAGVSLVRRQGGVWPRPTRETA